MASVLTSTCMGSGSASAPAQATSTSLRPESIRIEIQQLVIQGVESPRIELTRECSLASDNKESQVDFAKTIQGLANAHPGEERVYVVGADQKKKRFCSLNNDREFDTANLRQVLEKYLEPLPRFEAHILETGEQSKFAAVILAAEQPRPIVAKANVQAADGKRQILQKGDIWIKKSTSLVRADRDDLEAFYETRIETESERRAAKRFSDMRNGIEASLRLQLSPERRIPSDDLIFGPNAEYKAYVEQLIANDDILRFRMLITTLHDLLVERWHSVNAFDSSVAHGIDQASQIRRLAQRGDDYARAAAELEKPALAISDHFRDVFIPALHRLAYTGLVLLKHDLNQDWFAPVADLVAEVFELCASFAALPEPGIDASHGLQTKGTVGLEVLLVGKALATYVVRARRYGYLAAILKKCVTWIGASSSKGKKPLLFWPLRMNVPGNDRIAYAWEHAVQPYWIEFFGSEQSYLGAACGLEFILHLNSYLATKNADASGWVGTFKPDVDFQYWYGSDLWRYPLETILPLAEDIYRALAMGPNAALLVSISVEQGVFQKAFQPGQQSISGSEQQIFVHYLKELYAWQAQAALSMGHFQRHVDWGPILGPLVTK